MLALRRLPVTGLAALAVAWIVLVSAVPYLSSFPPDSAPSRTAALVHIAAGRICHQRLDRTLSIEGRPFPVCGRCLALYLGGAFGLVAVAGLTWRRPTASVAALRPLWVGRGLSAEATWLVAAAVPTIILAGIEWTWADPGTWTRAVVSLPLGLVVGVVCGLGLARPSSRPVLLH